MLTGELLLTLPMAADAIVFERWQATVEPNLTKRREQRRKHSLSSLKGWNNRRVRG